MTDISIASTRDLEATADRKHQAPEAASTIPVLIAAVSVTTLVVIATPVLVAGCVLGAGLALLPQVPRAVAQLFKSR